MYVFGQFAASPQPVRSRTSRDFRNPRTHLRDQVFCRMVSTTSRNKRQVLFIYNEHLATEALLGEAFTECGFDVDTFEVVPADRIDNPAGDVTFPDPTGYDVIVPLGARWPVYDDALRRTWVGARAQLVRDAADGGGCGAGSLLRRSTPAGVRRVGGAVNRPGDRVVRRRH